jgi:hypothetical protein
MIAFRRHAPRLKTAIVMIGENPAAAVRGPKHVVKRG